MAGAFTRLCSPAFIGRSKTPCLKISNDRSHPRPRRYHLGSKCCHAVINIITKRAQETHGTLVSTGGGNIDQGFVNFRYGAGNSKGFNYRIYGKAFTRGPEFHPDHQQFDDWRMGQIGSGRIGIHTIATG